MTGELGHVRNPQLKQTFYSKDYLQSPVAMAQQSWYFVYTLFSGTFRLCAALLARLIPLACECQEIFGLVIWTKWS